MPALNTSSILIGESERLGSSQRKILDLLESQLDGLTSNEMLEQIYRIPTTLGALLQVSMNLRLFLDGEGEEVTREEIIGVAEGLVTKIQDYVLLEEVDFAGEGECRTLRLLPASTPNFRRFKAYLDYCELQDLQEAMQAYIAISSGDDALTTHEYLFEVMIRTIRIGETTQGFRKELRVLRATGEQEGEGKTRRKILANRLRANLAITLSTMEKRDLVLQNIPAKRAYWKGRPSRFVITERGYRLLQRARAA